MAVKDISSRLEGFSKIPIICGPTASGKSAIALRLCEITGGELLSCDSMQIYKHLDVGTAKATKEERDHIPHHLTDIVEPGTYFSVNDYIHRCYDAIEDCLNRGKLPVICGGTGQSCQPPQPTGKNAGGTILWHPKNGAPQKTPR